jgi:Ca2+-transporting ATPase
MVYPLDGETNDDSCFDNIMEKELLLLKRATEALINLLIYLKMKKASFKGYEKGFRRMYRVWLWRFPTQNNDYPLKQQDFKFDFKGLVAFYDP